MIYIIDRFEGDIAVCENENRECIDVHKRLLPDNVFEGFAINIDESGKITVLNDAERQRFIAEVRERVRKKYL